MTSKLIRTPCPRTLFERTLKRKHGIPEGYARAIAELRDGKPDK